MADNTVNPSASATPTTKVDNTTTTTDNTASTTTGTTTTPSDTDSTPTDDSGKVTEPDTVTKPVDTSTTAYTSNTNLPISAGNKTVEIDLNSEFSIAPDISNYQGNLKCIVIGNLPIGTNIDSNTAVFSGKATGSPMQDIIELQFSDAVGNTGKCEYTITVNPALGVNGPNAINATTGAPIASTLVGTGGSGSYNYTLTTPVLGLAVGYTTGSISGSITKAGSYPISITVSDGIATTTFSTTIVVAQGSTSGSSSVNFTQHRTATLGMAKLKTAIALRTKTMPNLRLYAQDLISATKALCKDPTPEFVAAYTQMHITYSEGFLSYNHAFDGMFSNVGDSDIDLYDAVWWAFKQCVVNDQPDSVDWEGFLRLTCSQNLMYYLQHYNDTL